MITLIASRPAHSARSLWSDSNKVARNFFALWPHRRSANSTLSPPRNIVLAVVALWMLIDAWDVALGAPKPAASIPAADLIQPAELAGTLRSPAEPKPLILQVGFRTLYDQSHLPGA